MFDRVIRKIIPNKIISTITTRTPCFGHLQKKGRDPVLQSRLLLLAARRMQSLAAV